MKAYGWYKRNVGKQIREVTLSCPLGFGCSRTEQGTTIFQLNYVLRLNATCLPSMADDDRSRLEHMFFELTKEQARNIASELNRAADHLEQHEADLAKQAKYHRALRRWSR